MYAILAEDDSDVAVLRILIERISLKHKHPQAKFRVKGYGGCHEMLRKGARDIRLFLNMQCKNFVICYDADKDCPSARYDSVLEKIIKPSNLSKNYCILVPVQEIESWIIADFPAVQKVIPSWKNLPKAHTQPEQIKDPKEHLERLSKRNGKPLYIHAVHNQKVAQHLDIEALNKKCPSFQPLFNFVRSTGVSDAKS